MFFFRGETWTFFILSDSCRTLRRDFHYLFLFIRRSRITWTHEKKNIFVHDNHDNLKNFAFNIQFSSFWWESKIQKIMFLVIIRKLYTFDASFWSNHFGNITIRKTASALLLSWSICLLFIFLTLTNVHFH